ncbi:hypothetical protein ACTXT7_002189 [Hymenolepis weldensis]
MSKRAHCFPSFYNLLVSPKKHICAHVLARPYPTHACLLPAPILPAHLLSTSASSPLSLSVTRFKPVVVSLNTFWSNQLLVFCSTIVVSSYSNSCELATVIAVVIY